MNELKRQEFETEVREKVKEGFKFGENKPFIEGLAEKYEISESMASFYFYALKKQVKEDEDGNEGEEEMMLTPTYEIDQEVDVKVKNIYSYGVICEDNEGKKMLLHISNVRDEFIPDLNRYFRIGDELNAKIITIGSAGEIAISTLGYELPDYHHELKKEDINENNEFMQIENYLKPIIGELSDLAKSEFKKIIKEKGLFQLSITLAKIAPSFKADLGVLLAQNIQKELDECL